MKSKIVDDENVRESKGKRLVGAGLSWKKQGKEMWCVVDAPWTEQGTRTYGDDF
jgi:hypothetical protein